MGTFHEKMKIPARKMKNSKFCFQQIQKTPKIHNILQNQLNWVPRSKALAIYVHSEKTDFKDKSTQIQSISPPLGLKNYGKNFLFSNINVIHLVLYEYHLLGFLEHIWSFQRLFCVFWTPFWTIFTFIFALPFILL